LDNPKVTLGDGKRFAQFGAIARNHHRIARIGGYSVDLITGEAGGQK